MHVDNTARPTAEVLADHAERSVIRALDKLRIPYRQGTFVIYTPNTNLILKNPG